MLLTYKKNMSDTESDSSDSEGSLKDFIVKDEEESDSISEASDESGSEIEISEESDDESDESDDESDESEESEDDQESQAKNNSQAKSQNDKADDERPKKKIKLASEKEDETALLKEEAEKFTAGVKSTVVGSRVLRSRDPNEMEKRKAKDTYYERFGRAEEEKLMEKFKKKDIIDFLKTLESEWRSQYEQAGHKWPSPTLKWSLESIEEVYYPIKQFANLPDSDDEEEAEIDSDEDDENIDEELEEEI